MLGSEPRSKSGARSLREGRLRPLGRSHCAWLACWCSSCGRALRAWRGSRPRLEPVKVHGQQSTAPPSSRAGALLLPILRFVIQRQRFVHGSHGVTFCRSTSFRSELTNRASVLRRDWAWAAHCSNRALPLGRWLTDGLRDAGRHLAKQRALGMARLGCGPGSALVASFSLPSTSSDTAIRTS